MYQIIFVKWIAYKLEQKDFFFDNIHYGKLNILINNTCLKVTFKLNPKSQED